MMKKALLFVMGLMIFTSLCFAEAPTPTKKIVLFYLVKDEILQCQNPEEDKAKGAKELEKELVNHYSNRFIVQDIQRYSANKNLSAEENLASLFNKIKANQEPFVVGLQLDGQGQSSTTYQNAFGAKTTGIAPTVNVRLFEIMPDDTRHFYYYDYGIQSYGAGTFAVGRYVYTAEKDPRKNTKNAVRGVFRDACKFNDKINKYADSKAYENEYNRFTGNFKAGAIEKGKVLAPLKAKIEKFIAWCNQNEAQKVYLVSFNTFGDNLKMKSNYIEALKNMGIYKEEDF